MNLASAFCYMEDRMPLDTETDQTPVTQTPEQMHAQYTGFSSQPMIFGLDGYIAPYPSNNWYVNSPILSSLDDESRFPALENRLDPNKIFSPDLTALKALAADQLKIKKMFERCLMESLRERGKIGVSEEEIMAMQAVTAATSAITSIQNAQSSIKKNIAEIRLKQQQQANAQKGSANGTAVDGQPINPATNMGIGRSILDDIFSASGVPVDTSDNVPSIAATEMELDNANRVLDELVPDVDAHIQYEHLNPKTYVLVGDTDDDVEFVTYTGDGRPLPEYPLPESQIVKIDRESMTAQDSLMENYPVKLKNEM